MAVIDYKKLTSTTPVKPPVNSTVNQITSAALQTAANNRKASVTGVPPINTATAITGSQAPTSATRINPALPTSMTSAKDMYMKGQLAPYLAPKATTSLFGIEGTKETPLPGVSKAVGITETGAENGGFTGLDKTATGENMYLAGDPNAPSVQVYNGRSFISYPDGRRELVDTPEEQSIATELSGYERQQKDAEAANIAQQQANRQGYDYAMQGLVGAEAVDRQAAQELQNRRGGFYSGGLDYQLGAIGSSYAQQRGQLSQDFNRVNQELNARYGAQTENIRNNITSLLTAAPGKIAEAIEAAKQKKNQEAMDMSKITGYYVPPGAQDSLNQLLVLKQKAEAPGITPEERSKLSAQADVIRGTLTAMGVDTSKLGASSNLKTAATSPFGIRTEEGKQADIKQAQDERDFKYDQERDAISDGWKVAEATGKIPASLAKILGVSAGTQTAQAKQDRWNQLWDIADAMGTLPDELADLIKFPRGSQTQEAKQQAIDNDLRWDAADLNWIQENRLGSESGGGGSSEKIDIPSDATSGAYLKNLLSTSIENPDTGKMETKYKSDYNAVKNAFEAAYNTMFVGTDAPASAIIGMLIKAGVSPENIAKLKKEPEYADAFIDAITSSGGGSGVEVPQKYKTVIDKAQSKYGLGGSNLLAKIASAESSFNPKAKNRNSGASGMFQFMPATAKGYGIDPFNVEQAADAAGKMITGLIAKYDGDTRKAVAAYNYGGGNVDKLIRRWGKDWLKHAPEETRNYVKKIMG